MYGKIKNIHFVGIGGIGMSGIAEILLNLDYSVSGSDIKESGTVNRLRDIGAKISIGHRGQNIENCDVVVISSAISSENPEISAAKEKGIPVIPRAEMLAELMRLKYGIAVAGSHGKTTTTSMVSTVLSYAGLDPTIVVGGRVKTLGSNARLGHGEFMVVEADESDGSFLTLSPVISVVTNLDREHLDHYKNMDELVNCFSDFINKLPFYGLAIICIDSPWVDSLIKNSNKRIITYGFSENAELRAINIEINGFQTNFDIELNKELLGNVELNVPGEHNALNALAAIAIGIELGIDVKKIINGLEEFKGIDRRMQVKGETNDIIFLDDYAHHPEEIKVTLKAIKDSLDRRLVLIFQPHRYSRTSLLFEEFVDALKNVEVLLITDIYPAGESPVNGTNSEKLVNAIRKKSVGNVIYVNEHENLVNIVKDLIKPNDAVITFGAGNVWRYGEEILREIS